METMESVHEAVRVWRREHDGRRGPLPHELRRRAAALAAQLGDGAVGDRLDVEPELVGRWRERFGVSRPTGPRQQLSQTSAFVEVKPESVPALAPRLPGSELRVEVSAPGGRVVRIEGAMDLRSLSAVIRAAVGAAGTEE